VRAMRENYRFQAKAEGYFVYVPKEGEQRAER
jgi:hypothetical protein